MGSFWKKAARAAGALLALFCASGCWDALEIEQRAVILGLSIDLAGSGIPETDPMAHPVGKDPSPDHRGYHVTAQIALPGKIPLGPGEGGGAGGSDKTLWVVGESGHSIDDAIANLQQEIAYQLFFGHIRVVVISEEVARDGLEPLNDYFTRNPEMRRTKWIAVSKGRAEEILKIQPPIGRVPTSFLVNTFDQSVKMGLLPQNFAGIFWSHAIKRGQEGFLPYIKKSQAENISIIGMAIFRGNKMVETQDMQGIAQYMAVKGMNPGGFRISFPYQGATVTLYSTYRNSRIKAKIRNGLPEFDVYTFIEFNLEEKSSETFSLSDQNTLDDIIQTSIQSAQKKFEDNIKKTQVAGADIYGFGEIIRAKKPGYWNKNIKTKEKWQEMYREVKVNIHLDGSIRRVGMKIK
jgi:spore germination protein KC